MSSINRNSSTRSSAHAPLGASHGVAAPASRPNRVVSTPAYNMPITSRSGFHPTPGLSRRQPFGETSSPILAQLPSTAPSSGRWRPSPSHGNPTAGGNMASQRKSLGPSDETGSSRWRAGIARVGSSVRGGSLCGSTTDVVENAHVAASAARQATWRNNLIGAGFSPNSAGRVATALETGDFTPVLRAQSPTLEAPLEPNPTDPRIRFAARSLALRGALEVPASWVESGIHTDPQSLARSPALSEYDRWVDWQKSHPGGWSGGQG